MAKYATLKEMFAERNRWIQYRNAKDEAGNTVEPKSDSAVCWCLYGGYKHVYGNDQVVYNKLLQAIAKRNINTETGCIEYDGLMDYNDFWNRKAEDIQSLVAEAGV